VRFQGGELAVFARHHQLSHILPTATSPQGSPTNAST
jgi:hypothetical protein